MFAKVVATFNLCKMDYAGAYHKLLNKCNSTNCFIYADDGNTEIHKDCYGKPLLEMSIKDVIEALEKEDKTYRRIPPVLGLLKSFDLTKWRMQSDSENPNVTTENLVVLHYGY